jgi:hypothetical protein
MELTVPLGLGHVRADCRMSRLAKKAQEHFAVTAEEIEPGILDLVPVIVGDGGLPDVTDRILVVTVSRWKT